jgi:hypothetical protein
MTTPTFKHSITFPIAGSHKLKRFTIWAAQNAPEIAYRLPPQAPIKTETLTIRLSSLADRQRLEAILPAMME